MTVLTADQVRENDAIRQAAFEQAQQARREKFAREKGLPWPVPANPAKPDLVVVPDSIPLIDLDTGNVIGEVDGLDEGATVRYTRGEVLVRVLLDGKDIFEEAIDVMSMLRGHHRSLMGLPLRLHESDGHEFLLRNCGCGEPGCANIDWLTVLRRDDRVVWRLPVDGYQQYFKSVTPVCAPEHLMDLEFDRQQLDESMEQLKVLLMGMMESGPICTFPDAYGDGTSMEEFKVHVLNEDAPQEAL